LHRKNDGEKKRSAGKSFLLHAEQGNGAREQANGKNDRLRRRDLFFLHA
jgi:hypothetical protein